MLENNTATNLVVVKFVASTQRFLVDRTETTDFNHCNPRQHSQCGVDDVMWTATAQTSIFSQQGLTTSGNSRLLSTRKNTGNRQNYISIALSPTVDDSLKSTLETTGGRSAEPTPSVLPGI